MSQDYFSGKGKTPLHQEQEPSDPLHQEQEPSDEEGNAPAQSASSSSRPAYMTVGTGSTSQHAARLQAMLDNDSGYGGSIAGDEVLATSALNADRHMASRGAIHQLWYNQHRLSLGRFINHVITLLEELQEMNATWPAHYPSVQRAEISEPPRSPIRPSSQRGISELHTSLDDSAATSSSTPTPGLRRAFTSVEDSRAAESSRAAADKKSANEPRLMSPQIAQEFSVLKLDLKLGALHQAELVHSLEKASIASLLDGKISTSIKHLLSLRDRIEDTSSKVLITGDLNAGKSTFCNALLRRKILPEDQQPCTAIFCEVLDARENSSLEEVHAVHKDSIYNRHDESTYDVFTLLDLEKIVTDNVSYGQCKIYVKDVRTVDESLLNNGVVDIALIDAPGLNADTTQTTAIFARQEEIDVVVFVVSASNHFTMSAKEFMMVAAAEKAYLFIVVNGFDAIRDKERCQKMILDQVNKFSPQTHKEASELVHFVSSNAIPMAPSPPGGPGSGGGSSGGGGGDDPSDDPKGKGKDLEKIRDFGNLEGSLRRFVLEKRARSKLAPAKTYLLNILNDINVLATVNTEVAQAELDRVVNELGELEPQLASGQKVRNEIGGEIDQTIDETCQDVYDHTRSTITSAISHAGNSSHGVPYPGLLGVFQYAEEIKDVMLSHIAESVTRSEEYARGKTIRGVNVIKQLGILHLGDEYQNLNFRPEVMFSRRRDTLARQVDIPTELWDFVDWSTLVQRQEKMAGTGMALTVATAVGSRMVGFHTWTDHALSAAKVLSNDNLRRLIIPGMVTAGTCFSYLPII
jgi:mitofusin 2